MSGLNQPIKNIAKTTKLFINGEFPRTESGRSYPVMLNDGITPFCYLCQASRKDLRGAVETALAGQKKWAKMTAYNRGQILYRMAEMLEGKRNEITSILQAVLPHLNAPIEVDGSIDKLVYYAGFADKFSQLAGTINPVSGPFHNFTTPEPVGVVGAIYDGSFSLVRFFEQLAVVLCSGNAIVVVFDKPGAALLSEIGEICKTSDLPGGVINLLSGKTSELTQSMAEHMEIQSLLYFGDNKQRLTDAKSAAIYNMKRVVPWTFNHLELESILAFTEMKTVWHPVGM